MMQRAWAAVPRTYSIAIVAVSSPARSGLVSGTFPQATDHKGARLAGTVGSRSDGSSHRPQRMPRAKWLFYHPFDVNSADGLKQGTGGTGRFGTNLSRAYRYAARQVVAARRRSQAAFTASAAICRMAQLSAAGRFLPGDWSS